MMQNSNLKIAITGGIGSGKSTVANFLMKKGYQVLSCDEVYGKLLEDNNYLNKIVAEFGKNVISNGKLNRSYLSALVFSDDDKLRKLNAITHSQIINRCLDSMTENISFCEVPLLFENYFERLFDKVIVVLRDKKDRISAVMERNKLSVEEITKRINSQYDYDNSDFAEYYVVHNDGNLWDLQNQVEQILIDIEKQ